MWLEASRLSLIKINVVLALVPGHWPIISKDYEPDNIDIKKMICFNTPMRIWTFFVSFFLFLSHCIAQYAATCRHPLFSLGDNQGLQKTLALMALHLQAQLAEHHNVFHFNLPSNFGFSRREIKSVRTTFEATARTHINSLR